jgi:hypothetical protein
MTVRKKSFFIVAVAAGLLLAFMASVPTLASLYLNRPVMKEQIRSALSREINGTVNFERLDAALLPLPHLTVRKLDIVFTETAAIRSKTVAVYPQLIPLMQGRVLLSKIELVEPEVTVFLQEKPGEELAIPSLPEVKKEINKIRAELEMIGPGFVVQMVKGRLAFFRHERTVLTLKDIDASVAAPRDFVEVTVHAVADAWGPLALKGTLTYDNERVELSGVSGTLGRSSFSGLSARLTLARPMNLQVVSGKVVLSLDELYPWLLASDEGGLAQKYVQSAKGSVTLSALGFGGPLLRVSDWQMTVSGNADDVTMRTSFLPAPLTLNGSFTASREAVEVKGLSVTLGRSNLSHLSAWIDRKKDNRLVVHSGEATIALDQIYEWRLLAPPLQSLLKDVSKLSGTARLTQVSFSGPLEDPALWNIAFQGEAKDVIVESALLPAPLSASGRFARGKEHLEFFGLSAALGRSSVDQVSARIDWKETTKLNLRSGSALIALDELYQWRKTVDVLDQALMELQELKGTARLSAMNVTGDLSRNADWQVTLAGSVEGLTAASPHLPGPISIAKGAFRLEPGQLSVVDARGTVLDSSLTLSGIFKGFPGTLDNGDLSLEGTIGPGSIQWAFDTFALPKELMVNPFSLSKARIAWQRSETASLTGTAALQTGQVVFIDLARTAKGISIHRASIKDQDSNALFTYDRQNSSTTLSFTGSLAQTTLNRIFPYQTIGKGKITGTLQATLLTDKHQESLFQGSLSGDDIVIPWLSNEPVRLDHISLHGDQHSVAIDSATVALGNSRGLVTGTVSAATEGFFIGLAAAADRLDMNEIQTFLSSRSRKDDDTAEKTTVTGTIKVQATSLLYGKYTFTPVRGEVVIGPSRVDATIVEAGLCGLSTPGTLIFTPGEVQLDFRPGAHAQQLSTALECLQQVTTSMSGTFDLASLLTTRGKGSELLSKLDGKVELTAKDGVIRKHLLLARIFSILSVTEIFRGKLPDFGGSGFTYHTLMVQGTLKQGKFLIEQAFIDGTSITLIATGEIDIAAGTTDLVVLVAPFSSVDWFIRHIPLLGKVMGGTLISIPVKVSGKRDDPKVTILAPSAVGSRIEELFKNFVELPVDIISPILQEGTKEEK